MNEPSHRMNLHQRSGKELDTTQHTRPESGVLEFHTAEELLRHDAATVPLPESIGERLAESAVNSPADPWWRRLFKG